MKPRIAGLRTLGLALLAALASVAACSGAGDGQSVVQHRAGHLPRATSASGATVENWADETSAANIVAGDEASSGSSQVGHFVSLLPASGYQLSEIESRLRSSGAYVPVAHLAWSQTARAWGTRAGFPVQRLGAEVPGLSGTVFLERGQYLHLGMTLSFYVDPAPPGALGAAAGTTFSLNPEPADQILRT